MLKNFVERMEKQEPKIFADLLKPEDVGLPAKSAAQVEGQQMQVQVKLCYKNKIVVCSITGI